MPLLEAGSSRLPWPLAFPPGRALGPPVSSAHHSGASSQTAAAAGAAWGGPAAALRRPAGPGAPHAPGATPSLSSAELLRLRLKPEIPRGEGWFTSKEKIPVLRVTFPTRPFFLLAEHFSICCL